MFGSEDALIKIDMSEFMERHNVSRLVGAPPGYVGFEEGGQLTEAVRRKSYSVVLLDEIEKAHPEVFNILLQILEDGHLTDAKGRRVDFRNTVIIMTSNVGAKSLLKDTTLGFRPDREPRSSERDRQYDRMKDKVLEQLKSQFRPEFLNRVDSLVVFRSLTVEEIREIVDLLLARVREQLRIQHIDLEVTQEAKDHIIKIGYDVDYGARPLRRVIQNHGRGPARGGAAAGYASWPARRSSSTSRRRRPDHRAARGEDAGRGHLVGGAAARAVTSARPAAPSPPRWEGRCHVLRRLGHRSSRPSCPPRHAAARRRAVRAAARRRGTPRPLRAVATPAGAATERASTRSTGSSAAGSCQAPSSCSAASPASASRRSCSRPPPASPRRGPAGADSGTACSTPRARSRPTSSTCGPTALG